MGNVEGGKEGRKEEQRVRLCTWGREGGTASVTVVLSSFVFDSGFLAVRKIKIQTT